jgi:hypothetical protein
MFNAPVAIAPGDFFVESGCRNSRAGLTEAGNQRHTMCDPHSWNAAAGRIIMPIVQGGPPEWTWERPAEKCKWELNRSRSPQGSTNYELRIHCGLEILRLQFFTPEEFRELRALLKSVE